jgi:hypothetical protein
MNNFKKYAKITLIALGVCIALYYMVTDWIPSTIAENARDPYDTMK